MTRDDRSAPWQLVQASTGAKVMLVGLTAVVPVVVIGAALAIESVSGASPEALGGRAPLTMLAIVGGVVLLGGLIGLVIARAMGRHRVVLDGDAIEVATTFHKRRLSRAQLRLDEARVVDLDEHTGLKPMFKTNGTAIPGFRSGWFRLRNREKALVAMAGGPRVAWIPTTEGYGLLLQPRQPQALLDALRAAR